jgi:hypothetical protein
VICQQVSTKFPQLAHAFFTVSDQEDTHKVISETGSFGDLPKYLARKGNRPEKFSGQDLSNLLEVKITEVRPSGE